VKDIKQTLLFVASYNQVLRMLNCESKLSPCCRVANILRSQHLLRQWKNDSLSEKIESFIIEGDFRFLLQLVEAFCLQGCDIPAQRRPRLFFWS